MPQINPDDYVPIERAAEIVKRSRQTIRRWIRRGDLPRTVWVKQQFLIHRLDLMDMFVPVSPDPAPNRAPADLVDIVVGPDPGVPQ
jgi:hypothetical protein